VELSLFFPEHDLRDTYYDGGAQLSHVIQIVSCKKNLPMEFHRRLFELLDKHAHLVYKVTRKFPKEELFGTTSQYRRSAISMVLNYKEGYARKRRLVKIHFYEISYGSSQEADYLADFSYVEKWISAEEHKELKQLNKEISSMLWKTIEGLEKDTGK
jgi:four helix bundle protein